MKTLKIITEEIINLAVAATAEYGCFRMTNVDVPVKYITQYAEILKESEGDLGLLTYATAIRRYCELAANTTETSKGFILEYENIIIEFEKVAMSDNKKKPIEDDDRILRRRR